MNGVIAVVIALLVVFLVTRKAKAAPAAPPPKDWAATPVSQLPIGLTPDVIKAYANTPKTVAIDNSAPAPVVAAQQAIDAHVGTPSDLATVAQYQATALSPQIAVSSVVFDPPGPVNGQVVTAYCMINANMPGQSLAAQVFLTPPNSDAWVQSNEVGFVTTGSPQQVSMRITLPQNKVSYKISVNVRVASGPNIVRVDMPGSLTAN